MNWKNVAHLIRVDRKSGRLIRGRRLTRYRESRTFTYLLYGGALLLGSAIGTLAGLFYNSVSGVDPEMRALFDQGLLSLFLSLPTLILIYSLVFTMMQQIQRSGAKFSVQVPYWLPITWDEHTLASILANLLGFPLISIVFIGSAVIAVSILTGQVVLGVLTFFALLASAFLASAITEILRVLQVRFIGAVYKSSGRAAVWVRFVGSILFFLVFYIIYFFITSGAGALAFVQTFASGQSTIWFIPFVWLGMMLYSFIKGMLFEEFIFMILSVLFILSLFYLAVALNKRYGFYEPPAITVSRGVYAPRTGFLNKLGFSTAETAIMRKDLKAFTRRRELMYIFILPIVLVIFPLIQTGASSRYTPAGSLSSLALIFLMPSAIVAVFLGSIIIGEEGAAVWRIYASPVSAESLVKSKYTFMLSFSTLVLSITGIVGTAIFHPSFRATLIAFAESFLLMFALSAISLANGIKGADFTELPRPRMIRRERVLINLIACFLAALAILAPFIPSVLMLVPFMPMMLGMDLSQSVAISAAISSVITLVAYRLALKNAKELLRKAET